MIREENLFSEAGRGQFEISDLLLLAFVLFLFLEGYLACRFARHKRTSTAAEEGRRETGGGKR